MNEPTKIFGEERRAFILKVLKESKEPITGSELASRTNVSRQVIVGDITLLKARNEQIIATSQGYLYITASNPTGAQRIIACAHAPERTEEELILLVDHGVTIKDVKIEHPVYGDLTAAIMVSNRYEVKQFIEKVRSTKAAYLSELTGGIHLHSISASTEKALDDAQEALKKANFLVDLE